MDRVIQYPGAVPLETDILNTNKFALSGLAKLAKTVLGSGPWLVDFTCIPTAPASLSIQVTAGQIYQMAALDSTAYSSLAADAHQVLKQGILWDAVTLSCPAPTTSGYSINYLIEIGYFDNDTSSVVLPYYNSASPNTPYSGPNNSGAAQNTVRQGLCSVQVKAGAAATTGTQATPAPDAGYIGAFVVTVAYGQSTITAGNITTYPNAPLINSGVATSVAGNTYAPLAGATFTGPISAPSVTANGTTTQQALTLPNAVELAQTIAASPAATQTIYLNTGSVIYFTTAAANNWVLNVAFSSGAALNAVMAVGQTVTLAVLVTQGATAYYATGLQIDGTAVTPKWQGGTAPISGDANAVDVYTYAITKTASATYTVLASATKFA